MSEQLWGFSKAVPYCFYENKESKGVFLNGSRGN
jgi:hypothetical protein